MQKDLVTQYSIFYKIKTKQQVEKKSHKTSIGSIVKMGNLKNLARSPG